ncbi:DMT family transporter [Arenicella xantha]|uniref:EamA domain-containing protein n=1 Tax=Arenicella xantha TaxID=644221 RepID=A0A395JGB9_9GAMM|nr:DMT family transporter [Arenicella xantha]RBP48863.1 hypothetical protein DFR28_105202 [Arenicella xantha]
MSQKQAMYYGLAAVLCWSTVATAFKLSLVHLSPTQLILLASVTSWLFVTVMLAIQGKFTDLFQQTRQTYIASFLYGLLNPTLYYLLLFTAYDLLPAQEAQAINYSWAIVMSFLAVPLLGQKLTRSDILAAVICYLGVLVIATRGNVLGLEFANLQGVLFAVISTVVWSLYWILNRRDNRDALLGLCLNFTFAVPLIAVYAWWSGELQGLDSTIHWQAWVGGVYVGLFEMGIAFVLWLQAMKRATNTSRIANLIFVSPFLSLVLIATFLHEPILPSTVVGLVLILGGLVLQQRYSTK